MNRRNSGGYGIFVPRGIEVLVKGQVAAIVLLVLGVVVSHASAEEDGDPAQVVSEKDADAVEIDKLRQKRLELIEENKRLELEFQTLRIKYDLLDTSIMVLKDTHESRPIWAALVQLRGTVREVNDKWGFIVVDVGSATKIKIEGESKGEAQAPLEAGMTMDVFRDERKIAILKILKVNDYSSVCDVVSQDEKIEIGDQVQKPRFEHHDE